MKKFYQEASRKIPVAAETDILVAGGGPAGIGAAIAAARCGARVMLIEKCATPGGMATTGMMSHWVGAEFNPIIKELQERCFRNPTMPPVINGRLPDDIRKNGICHEILKTELFRLLRECGVEVQIQTMAVGTIMDGNTVKGVITESKSGREAIFARTVIDATGDGDIAAFAGAEYLKGREEDGVMQPVTAMFMIAGVDYAKGVFPWGFENYINLPKGEIQALGRAHLKHPAGHVMLYCNRMPGEVCVNMTNIVGIDGTDVRDLTRATMQCREQMEEIILFLREYVPGYESCYISRSAEYVGIRETRHFKGVYTLRAEDIVNAEVFDDWIAARNAFNFDIHSLTGPGLDGTGAQRQFRSKGPYTIPFRACVPAKTDGLLLSGRNISGTHKAHSNYRVMGICLNIGQGVGTAAAVALKDGTAVRNADIKKVQKILQDAGCGL